MPHIRVRGITENTILKLSTTSAKLAEIIETTPDNFTFELVQTKFFENGKSSKGYPFIEVLWFARTQEMKNKLAECLTDIIKSLETHDYITVIFRDLETDSYFENGEHF